jgi:hypothetical protein
VWIPPLSSSPETRQWQMPWLSDELILCTGVPLSLMYSELL